MTFKGFWKFLIDERIGRRRPLPTSGAISQEDRRLRDEFEARLRRAFERLDITLDLYSLRPGDHKK